MHARVNVITGRCNLRRTVFYCSFAAHELTKETRRPRSIMPKIINYLRSPQMLQDFSIRDCQSFGKTNKLLRQYTLEKKLFSSYFFIFLLTFYVNTLMWTSPIKKKPETGKHNLKNPINIASQFNRFSYRIYKLFHKDNFLLLPKALELLFSERL